MTRENAIKIVEKKLNAAGIGEAIKISNSRTGTHGEAQCIYIDPIPVKGNSKLIKKLKDMPDFYGYKRLTLYNYFEFWGRFDVV